MMLIDDMGFNDFVGSDDMTLAWRHVNSILPQSIHINSSYGEPVCGPSRSAFLSGRLRFYLQDYWGVPGGAWGGFSNTYEIALPKKLAKSGYKSYAIGKWHVGSITWEMTPSGRGFSRYYGNYANGDHYLHCAGENAVQLAGYTGGLYDLSYEEAEPWESAVSTPQKPFHRYDTAASGQCCEMRSFLTTLYDNKAREFMQGHKQRYQDQGQHVPFFLYYAQYSFHGPMEAPDYYTAMCGPGDFESHQHEYRKTLCGMAFSLDDSIKNVSSMVHDMFPLDNWVMLINTDNGGPSWLRGSEGQNNLPLRGNKGEGWEGGVRSHALLTGSHPDLQTAAALGKTYTGGIMHFADWHATLAKIGHATDESRCHGIEAHTCGKSLWSALTHRSKSDSPSPRTELVCKERADVIRKICHRDGEWGGCKKGHWKLIKASVGEQGGKIAGNYWPIKNIPRDTYEAKYYLPNSGQFSRQIDMTWKAKAQTDWYLFNLDENPEEDFGKDLAGDHRYTSLRNYLIQRWQYYNSNGHFSTGKDNVVCADGGQNCENTVKQWYNDWSTNIKGSFLDSDHRKRRLQDEETYRFKALNKKAKEAFNPTSLNPCSQKEIIYYPWWTDALELSR